MADAHGCSFALRLARGGFALAAQASFPRGQMAGLFGLSGSGKTTLLRCLAGLETQATGRITVDGATWQDSAADRFVPPHRRSVGCAFQDARLFPHLDVRGNLAYASDRARGAATGPGFARIDRLLGISALTSRRVANLSGGEQRRVAIARALLANPSLLLLDEPLSGLDAGAKHSIVAALRQLETVSRAATILVSHELDEIVQLCDHLIVIDRGRVLREGPIRELLADPDLVGPERCGVLLDALVERYDAASGLTTLSCDATRFYVPGRIGAQRVRVQVLARDVSLCLQAPVATSVLNVVACDVAAIVVQGDHAQVAVEHESVRLLARISRHSLRELQLEPGRRVYAQIKGVAVRPAPAPEPATAMTREPGRTD